MLLLKNYALFIAPAFRLNHSVLFVATRRFLATSPSPPASQTQETGDKPKRFYKRDLVPPMKRPPSAFVAFAKERARKAKETSPTRVPFADTLRECSAAWKKLSDAEKKAYAPTPKAFEKYKAAAEKWYEELGPEARKALKNFRMRKTGNGYSLFLSESFNDAKANTIGEKVSEISREWRSLSTEKKEEYSKRALQTLYGIRARRAAQLERELERKAEVKRKAAEKAKKITEKKKEEARNEVLKRRAQILRAKMVAAVAKAKKEESMKKKVAAATAKAKKESMKKMAAAAAKAKAKAKAKKAQSGKNPTTKAKTKAKKAA